MDTTSALGEPVSESCLLRLTAWEVPPEQCFQVVGWEINAVVELCVKGKKENKNKVG